MVASLTRRRVLLVHAVANSPLDVVDVETATTKQKILMFDVATSELRDHILAIYTENRTFESSEKVHIMAKRFNIQSTFAFADICK